MPAANRRRAVPPRIAGVDFSGSVQAGRKIWFALAEPRGEALHVMDVRPAAALPGGAAARGPALHALRSWLRSLGPCAVGLDFPFGIHRSLAHTRGLVELVQNFARRFRDAEAFRGACANAGRERDLKRTCDQDARTPFAPHNLRLYRQTWHGIADVLAPLCAAGARLLPQQSATPGRMWLLETCPASALRRGGHRRPYKGREAVHRAARAAILKHLSHAGVRVPPRSRMAMLEDSEGDALASVLCAWIAWRAVGDPALLIPRLSAAHRVEGWV